MPIDSPAYIAFVIVVFAAYWCCRSCRVQNFILVAASIFFYGCWNWTMVGLLVGSGLWTYFIGLKLAQNPSRSLLTLAIAPLIGALGYFKYFNFFMGTSFNIILPLGISFYTFMAVGYLCDVYWKKIVAERDIARFGCFLFFFPQIVAGPIGRAGEMLPQYGVRREFNYPLAVEGCRQILWGAFKKFVVADNCATIAAMLLEGDGLGGDMIFVGMMSFTMQIYCDFSGYTDLAIGIGKLFGINLKLNFQYPYFATNVVDFWRRWHISLTSWFRDYVYIPLGGNRCLPLRRFINVMVVFLISGLWHGAAWTFVLWGGLHGLAVGCLAFVSRKNVKEASPGFWRQLIGWTLTMLFVSVAWLFFRAPNVSVLCSQLHLLVTSWGGRVWPHLPTNAIETLIIALPLLLAVEWLNRNEACPLRRFFAWRTLRWMFYFVLVFLVVCCNGGSQSFIYARF